jgi:hypothetical protein
VESVKGALTKAWDFVTGTTLAKHYGVEPDRAITGEIFGWASLVGFMQGGVDYMLHASSWRMGALTIGIGLAAAILDNVEKVWNRQPTPPSPQP